MLLIRSTFRTVLRHFELCGGGGHFNKKIILETKVRYFFGLLLGDYRTCDDQKI